MRKSIYLIFSIMISFSSLLAQKMIHTEMLGRPTNHSICVQAFFDTTVELSIRYGTSPSNYSNQTNWQTFLGNENAIIILDNLAEDTKYYYQLAFRSPSSSNVIYRPEYTFTTQRRINKSFSFTIQADPHLDEQSDTALYKLCLKNQLEDNPDFMIDLGDFLMSDKLTNASKIVPRDTITYRCNLLRTYYENIGHSVPLFIALGNHEGEAGWQLNNTANNVAVWGTLDRKKYFMNPAPNDFYRGDTINHSYVGQRENYYAWKWGDALFIVLDPYWYTSPKPDSLNGWRWTLGKTQYDWLKKTLEQDNSKFKFVFAHQIIGGDPDGRGGVEFADLYEWGGNNLNGTRGFETNRPGWYKPIKDLLTENRVSIFFHGHDHFFGMQQKNCLYYQEIPQPSHPNFTSIGQAIKYGYKEGVILPGSGHVRVTVDGNGAKVDYVRAYLPKNENGSRKNKDVAATYYIATKNCYDSLIASSPVIWNSNYVDELIYPNPFAEETKIELNLLSSDILRLHIYNQNGQMVRKLLNNYKIQQGKFQIIWDGKDDIGNMLNSGVYYYELLGENGLKVSHKILLNR
ncbi:MAG: metallophosphoesterase [Bacteroidota bacterium]